MVPGRSAAQRTADARIDVAGALLLGLTVLCVLLPVVRLEGGDRLPLLLLLAVPVLVWGFVRWEQRLVARGGAPLLDVALLRQVPGYAGGLAVGTLYFTGFTGVFLVLSVFLQEGRGLSPLTAGLLLTPFAVGSAVTAPLAGRVINRVGRPLTVVALAVMMVGVLATAVLVPGREDTALVAVLVPALLVAGLGGGGVISPNFTLTLAEVPTRMGGAAGGALQTGQRIGSATGAAVLMTAYQVALAQGTSPDTALRVALVTALALLSVAMVTAVRALRTP
jgi:predicted MFS family arabinose efflux permease